MRRHGVTGAFCGLPAVRLVGKETRSCRSELNSKLQGDSAVGEFPGLESTGLSGRGRSPSIKQQHVAQQLSVNAQLASNMQLQLQSVCQLALLGLCCVLITVRESDSTFVPGRCMCHETESRIRGPLKGLEVYPKSATCNTVTVIVTNSNNEPVCLNPEALQGQRLIRCWKRAHKLGRDVKTCLKMRRRKGKGRKRLRSRQRSQGHSARASSSSS